MYASTASALLPGAALSFTSPVFEPGRYTVTCLPARGANGDICNYTLDRIHEPGFLEFLASSLPDRRVRTYFVPTVRAMSAIILPQTSFTVTYPLDGERIIRLPKVTELTHKSFLCEGTCIGLGEGFLAAMGGCALVVLTGVGDAGDFCIAAHAGRDSLIAHSFGVRNAHRAHFSVMDTMVACARKMGAHPKDTVLRSFFILPWNAHPHTFDDPVYGDYNRKTYRLLQEHELASAFLAREDGVQCLSLAVLIALQAHKHGIGKVESGLLGLPQDGDFAYTRHADPELAGAVRNLVFLTRW